MQAEPEGLLQSTLEAFRDRFPLVIGDRLTLLAQPMVVAEGRTLVPERVAPVLSGKRQAIWLVPTESSKRASMARRDKPSFRDQVTDPRSATHNTFRRGMWLAEHVKVQARARELRMYQIDGSHSAQEIATLASEHFVPFLNPRHGASEEV